MTKLALSLWLLVATTLSGESFSGKVVAVTDGDTLKVLRTTGSRKEEVKVRLWGIDCPEKRQPYGQAAKKAASDLAFGQVVTVEIRSHDRYGRTVSWVTLPDGRTLNLELVRQGFAWWYEQYAKKAENLKATEAEARAAARGLWADANPIPPWRWRRVKSKI